MRILLLSLLSICVVVSNLSCRRALPPPAVPKFPTTSMLPITLHRGSAAITCGCRAPGGNFAFGTDSGRILITDGVDLAVKDAGLNNGTLPYAIAICDGKLIAETSTDCVVYNMSNWSRCWEKKKEILDWDLIVPFDEGRFFVAGSKTVVERVDLKSMEADFSFDPSKSLGGSPDRGHSVHSLAVSADGKLLALGFQGGASVVDLEVGSELHFFRMPSYGGHEVAFAPDSRSLYVAGTPLRSWDLQTGALICESSSVIWDVANLAVSPNGKLIALAEAGAVGFPGHFCLFDNQLNLIYRIEAGLGKISYLAFRENSTELITASFGGEIQLWDFAGDPKVVTDRLTEKGDQEIESQGAR